MKAPALGAVAALGILGVLVGAPFVVTAHWIINIGIFTLMYAALASAWNLVGGMAGYPSLGHAAFFGAGAYAEAIYFGHHGVGGGYVPFFVLPVAGVAVAAIAVPLGWISMRTRAATFAIMTITLLFAVQALAFNLRSLTGGSQGVGLPIPPFPAQTYERPFYFVMLALAALAVLTGWAALRGRVGLALLAVRADEEKALGVGVHVTAVKLLAFATSAGITGMVGGVWAYYVSFVYPQFAFDPLITVGMVLMAYLGGRATVWGPALGAFIVVPAQQYLAYRLGGSQLYLIAYSALFLVVMVFLPRGILPSIRPRRDRTPAAAAVADGPRVDGPVKGGVM